MIVAEKQASLPEDEADVGLIVGLVILGLIVVGLVLSGFFFYRW